MIRDHAAHFLAVPLAVTTVQAIQNTCVQVQAVFFVSFSAELEQLYQRELN